MPEVIPQVWSAIYHHKVILIRDCDLKKKKAPKLSGNWKPVFLFLLFFLAFANRAKSDLTTTAVEDKTKAFQNMISANFLSKTRGNRQSWLNKGEKAPTDKHLICLHNIWTKRDGNKPNHHPEQKSEFVFRTSEEELQHLKEAKAYVAESVELLIPAEMSQSTTQRCLPL